VLYPISSARKEKIEWFVYRHIVPFSLVIVGIIVGLSRLHH
jgi:hypothetical protein